MKEQSIEFSLSGSVTVDDGFIDDREIDGEKHRAWYIERPNGTVTITRFELDDSRPGFEPLWVLCAMPPYIRRMVAEMLEAEIRREQAEMVAQYDEERWSNIDRETGILRMGEI